jgi:hypothetical protein
VNYKSRFSSYRAENTLRLRCNKIGSTYNVTLRCVRVTIVAVEKQEVLHIRSVCLLTGVQHAMCMYHIILSPMTIFPHYHINGTIFEKKVIEHEMFFFLIFCTTFVWSMSHPKKRLARYDQKYILVFMWSARYSYHILMKLGFFRQIFEKFSNIKFLENPCVGSRVIPCGRTDGQIWWGW